MSILELHDVRKSFGGLSAINDLSLTVREGELRCIIGPNGAGKTTLFNLITGDLHPDQGEILYRGQPLNNMPIAERTRIGISRKFQTPSIFDDLDVINNLRVAAFGKLPLNILLTNQEHEDIEERVKEILDITQLTVKREHLAKTLSHGEKQRLEIGMVLMNQPELMLLDEPTAGMTPVESHEVSTLIKKIASETTTIVIEHDLKFVREIGRIITVLHHGKVLAEGPIDDIAQDDTVRKAYLGTKEL